MAYTVNELASMAGITVRTLHHYDQIGLLKPAFSKTNGYRYYEEKELLLLQQILFYRELGFALEDIKKILSRPEFDILEALENHKDLINKEISRQKGLLETLTKTIQKLKGERNMADKELYGSFTKEEVEKYKKEAREKWGDYEDRTEKLSKPEFDKLLEEGKEITLQLVACMEKGLKPGDKEVQAVIKKHFDYMQNFWDCNYEAYKNLGQMYVDDDRFAKNIDQAKEGLSVFMRDAMAIFSDNH